MADKNNKPAAITPEEKKHMHDVVIEWIGDTEKEEKEKAKPRVKKSAPPVVKPKEVAQQPVVMKPAPEPKPKPKPEVVVNPFAAVETTEEGYAAPKEITSPTPVLMLPKPHVRLLPILYKIALACFIAVVLTAGVSAKYKKFDYPYRYALSFVPLPYASLGTHPVLLSKVLDEADAVNKFYQQQSIPESARPSLAAMRDQVASEALRRAAANAIAGRYDVRVSNSELAEATQKLITEAGSREIAEDAIKNLWGWSLRDYQQNVIEPYLLKQKLAEALAKDPLTSRLIPPGSDGEVIDNYLDTIVESRARIYLPLQ
ncbi:MAG: hypothetical protein WC052_02780 [Patescibacteria group bacterium]|jgi:hypothetical protein